MIDPMNEFTKCRFTDAHVKGWRMASTYQADPELLFKRLQVIRLIHGASGVRLHLQCVCAGRVPLRAMPSLLRRWGPPLSPPFSLACHCVLSPQVKLQGGATEITVNVLDVCADDDCSGCCNDNTAGKTWKMLDIEKWAAADLLDLGDVSWVTVR
jgi:hypothetical protein